MNRLVVFIVVMFTLPASARIPPAPSGVQMAQNIGPVPAEPVTFEQTIMVHNLTAVDSLGGKHQNASLLSASTGSGAATVTVTDTASVKVVELTGDTATIFQSRTMSPLLEDIEPFFRDGPEAQPSHNGHTLYKALWWVIFKENVQIGADGTELFVYAGPSSEAGAARRVLVLLLGGGPGYVHIPAGVTGDIPYTYTMQEQTHQLHYVDIHLGGDGVLVSVNGEPNPADAAPKPWSEYTNGDKNAINQSHRSLVTQRSAISNSPIAQSITP